jgi:hypothetical protein
MVVEDSWREMLRDRQNRTGRQERWNWIGGTGLAEKRLTGQDF